MTITAIIIDTVILVTVIIWKFEVDIPVQRYTTTFLNRYTETLNVNYPMAVWLEVTVVIVYYRFVNGVPSFLLNHLSKI